MSPPSLFELVDKDTFLLWESIRESGICNMLAVKSHFPTEFSDDQVLAIISGDNYTVLKTRYLSEPAGRRIKGRARLGWMGLHVYSMY